MWWVMAVAIQGAAGPADPAASRRLAMRATDAPGCDATPDGGDVVVCGRSDRDAFRLKRMPERYVSTVTLPKAETKVLGDVSVAAESEAGQALGGGAPPRAMMRLKMPF